MLCMKIYRLFYSPGRPILSPEGNSKSVSMTMQVNDDSNLNHRAGAVNDMLSTARDAIPAGHTFIIGGQLQRT